MIGIRAVRAARHVFVGMAIAPILILASQAAANSWPPLRIDLGMDTGRNDTAAPGWVEWQVKDGAEATRKFNDLQITLRATGGGALRGVWFKAGLATGAIMVTDGVVVDGAAADTALEVEISGLSPGRHTLVTYHNRIEPNHTGGVAASVRDQPVEVEAQPTVRVAEDTDAESAYLEFTASVGAPVVLRIAASGNDGNRRVILNGLEVDAVDPKAKAVKPSPIDGDGHVDGENGAVTLSWRPSSTAVKHELYAATDADLQTAIAETASADKNSSAYRGEIVGDHTELDVPPHDSLLYHGWRVDSIDAAGKVTRGDVWTFRVRHLAFPGAEGYGRFAVGGRGGRVIKVTNLNDSGSGSLRAAVEADEPRTVIFDVSGRIVLKSRMAIRHPFITIAGQTSPGKGICISNFNLGMLGCHDAIVRYLRVRPGDPSGETMDGMGMASSDHSIIDHCSISWTQDEAFSSRGAKNITLQRTLISEALNIAGHKKYKKGKEHGYAASISGDIGSFHHNLLAHCAGRNWSLAGGLDKAGRHAGRLDIRNNVVYNWSHRTTDGGARQVNFVNNYYKPGLASRVFHVLMSEREAVPAFGPQDYYAAGNVMEGRYESDDPSAGVISNPPEPLRKFLAANPFFESYVTTQTAVETFEDVLADVGCNRPALDEHDRRVIEETRTGTTTYRGSISGHPGLPDSQRDVGGWDDYPEVHRPADWDSDEDGLPNAWETERGLNPQSPAGDFSDANADHDSDGYTRLEEYLNSLAMPDNGGVRAAAAPAEDTDAAYTRTVTERAQKIVSALDLRDPTSVEPLQEALVAQYRALREIHDARDAAIAKAKMQARGDAAVDAQLATIERETAAKLVARHHRFVAVLSALLSPQEVDRVKDGLTYGVVPITYRRYLELLPNLSITEKREIHATLLEAREYAMDGGSSEEKHAIFGKYKGRINNYLSMAGYDLKQAENDWAARRDAARDSKAASTIQ